MPRFTCALLAAAVLAALPTLCRADDLWVKSDTGVEIKEGKSQLSPTFATAPKGTQLSGVKEGRFYKISLNGKDGYVPEAYLSPKKIGSGAPDLGGLFAGNKATAAQGASADKGFEKEVADYASSQRYTTDHLAYMERLNAAMQNRQAAAELEKFMAEGRVGVAR